LQFDEHHIISGSLDKTIRVCSITHSNESALNHSSKIWDLRAGGSSETIRFDYPVTSLQFDSRKIVAATGENGAKVERIYSCPNKLY
jgi:division protein 1